MARGDPARKVTTGGVCLFGCIRISMASQTTPITGRLPTRLVEQLDQIAKNRCVSRSFLIRELVEAAVEGRVLFRLPQGRVGHLKASIGDLGTSDLSRAVQKRARIVAAAACRDARAASDVDLAAQDLDAVVIRAARLLLEGR
jgi:predicted transcriptional regulator